LPLTNTYFGLETDCPGFSQPWVPCQWKLEQRPQPGSTKHNKAETQTMPLTHLDCMLEQRKALFKCSWAVEMNESQNPYLQTYEKIDCIDHVIKNCNLCYSCNKCQCVVSINVCYSSSRNIIPICKNDRGNTGSPLRNIPKHWLLLLHMTRIWSAVRES